MSYNQRPKYDLRFTTLRSIIIERNPLFAPLHKFTERRSVISLFPDPPLRSARMNPPQVKKEQKRETKIVESHAGKITFKKKLNILD